MQSHLKLDFVLRILVFQRNFSTCLPILACAPNLCFSQLGVQCICGICEVVCYIHTNIGVLTHIFTYTCIHL